MAQQGQIVRMVGNDNQNYVSSTNGFPVAMVGSVTITATFLPILQYGVALASYTSITGNIPATASTVTLTATSYNVIITLSVGSAILYLAVSGTATTSNYGIPSGGSLSFTAPTTGISSFSIIGASATGTYSVFAH